MKKYLLLVMLTLWSLGLSAAEEFTLKDVNGKDVSLSDYRGKWVIVNYWATWCPPCKEEIPELIQFHDEHKDDLAVVLGVDLEDIDVNSLREFVDDSMISYPVLIGEGSEYLSELGPVPGLPTTYMVSPEGHVVARQVGPVTAEALEKFIERKMKK